VPLAIWIFDSIVTKMMKITLVVEIIEE